VWSESSSSRNFLSLLFYSISAHRPLCVSAKVCWASFELSNHIDCRDGSHLARSFGACFE